MNLEDKRTVLGCREHPSKFILTGCRNSKEICGCDHLGPDSDSMFHLLGCVFRWCCEHQNAVSNRDTTLDDQHLSRLTWKRGMVNAVPTGQLKGSISPGSLPSGFELIPQSQERLNVYRGPLTSTLSFNSRVMRSQL